MMMSAIETQEWYIALTDEIRAIHVERQFNAAQEVLRGYHEIGSLLVNDVQYQQHANGNGKILSRVSKSTGVSERNLYRAMRFYRDYPKFDLPYGKNFTWHKYCNGLLDDGKDRPAVSFKVRVANVINALDLAVREYPENKDEIVRAFWLWVRGEWT